MQLPGLINVDDKTRSSVEETEADAGVREALIPLAEWDGSSVKVNPTVKKAMLLADKLRIHASMAAGRVRYETNNWRLLNEITAEVRQLFEDQKGGVVRSA